MVEIPLYLQEDKISAERSTETLIRINAQTGLAWRFLFLTKNTRIVDSYTLKVFHKAQGIAVDS